MVVFLARVSKNTVAWQELYKLYNEGQGRVMITVYWKVWENKHIECRIYFHELFTDQATSSSRISIKGDAQDGGEWSTPELLTLLLEVRFLD